MSRHSRWLMEKNAYPAPCTVAYTQGYILALEDVLKDIESIYKNPEAEYGQYTLALRDVQHAVNESLFQARHTLEVLTK